MNAELHDKIEKLQALAERGVGGEKVTAQKKLKQLLKKYNISLEDIDAEKEQYYFFSIENNKASRKMFYQVVKKVMGYKRYYEMPIYKIHSWKYELPCTPSEKIEIELEYDFYYRLYKKEAENFLRAFIHKNDIFPDDEEPVDKELTEEDLKVLGYARVIEKKSRTLLLEEGEK